MATKVTMYEAKDGSLHKTPLACDAKNIELRLAPAIEAFVDALPGTAPGLTSLEAHGGGFHIELADLPTFLLAHSEALRKVLNDALIVKKPRKAKAASKPVAPAPATKPAFPAPQPASEQQQQQQQSAAAVAPAANDDDGLAAAMAAIGG